MSTPSKENHNPVTNNSSIISERTQNNNTTEKNEIASAILTAPSDPSLTLAGLFSNDKDESNRQEQLFICRYCSKFKTTLEREYQRAHTHRAPPGIVRAAASVGTDAPTYLREHPDMSALALDDGVIYHTYSTMPP
ncbi:MAG: hypothetical protein WAM42_05015 [Candidatus Nitrosopolaris sp.]